MDSMRSLNTSLPGATSTTAAPTTVKHQDPPEQLLTAFKAAALSVTNLYKSAAADQGRGAARAGRACGGGRRAPAWRLRCSQPAGRLLVRRHFPYLGAWARGVLGRHDVILMAWLLKQPLHQIKDKYFIFHNFWSQFVPQFYPHYVQKAGKIEDMLANVL